MSVLQRQEQILSSEEVVSRGREKADNQKIYRNRNTQNRKQRALTLKLKVCVLVLMSERATSTHTHKKNLVH